MKTFILGFMLSFSAIADVPSFLPKTSTCNEIQSAVELYGSVMIKVEYLLGNSEYQTYPSRPDCDAFHMSRKMKVRTSDGVKCFVGYYCDEVINP